MNWDRVWAYGRNSYIRLYPNPGVGVCIRSFRVAMSWYGGVELFRSHPELVWQRIGAWLSRVQRPGGIA
mgnify:CR=1 FL=1